MSDVDTDAIVSHEHPDAYVPRVNTRPIKRLDTAVINRIAAGEILQRPANALKELMENALDAGATMIRITLSQGGVRMLQVQDNGSGINCSDLPLLCERFATSKLRAAEDLLSMATFGFRGEALASLSYAAARVTVMTKTARSEVGYRATYSDGQLQSSPKACATTEGTSIQAESLFYSQPHRRRALGSDSEEYHRCLDVASKYAVQFAGRGVGVMCKRSGSNTVDLSTPSNPSACARDVIQQLYGKNVARELMSLRGSGSKEGPEFSVEGWMSSANWSGKKTVFLCFINDRLVLCPALKRALEALYTPILPRGGHPWIYISLTIAPEALDVNVHPAKETVHFIDEEAVIDAVASHAASALSPPDEQSRSRSFRFTQLQLPGLEEPSTARSQSKPQAKNLVRTDADAQTLENFFLPQRDSRPSSSAPIPGSSEPASSPIRCDHQEEESQEPPRKRPRNTGWLKIPESKCELTSIASLRQAVQRSAHKAFTAIVQRHAFVGIVDPVRALSLVQHETELYLIHHANIIEEFGYQLVLRGFGAFETIEFSPPLDVAALTVRVMAQDPSFPDHLDRDDVSGKIARKLLVHSELLDEYFGIKIQASSAGAQLWSLPALLPQVPGASGEWSKRLAGHGIQPGQIPALLVRLATTIDWTEEEACLSGVARAIGKACVAPASTSTEEQSNETLGSWSVKHVWFPAMHAHRGAYLPSADVQPCSVFKVADMPSLYRVFERC